MQFGLDAGGRTPSDVTGQGRGREFAFTVGCVLNAAMFACSPSTIEQSRDADAQALGRVQPPIGLCEGDAHTGTGRRP